MYLVVMIGVSSDLVIKNQPINHHVLKVLIHFCTLEWFRLLLLCIFLNLCVLSHDFIEKVCYEGVQQFLRFKMTGFCDTLHGIP